VVSLAAVLAVSHFTYLYVEIPGGRLMRNVLGGRSGFSASPARQTN